MAALPLLTDMRRDARHGAVRRALTWYVVWSLVALVLVTTGAVALCSLIARDEALDDARATSRAVADQVGVPLGTSAFHAGWPAARRAMAAALEQRLQDGSLRHIKLWSDEGGQRGRVVWSDQEDLVDQVFDMEEHEYALFGTAETVSEVSDLSRAENALERAEGSLLEVYAGYRDASGRSMLFEAYVSTAEVSARTQELLGRLLPLMIGALVILELTTLPLAVSLARRVDRAQEERADLLQHAVDSSDLERRRIAQDLHDGVIQDLAGVGYALSSSAGRVTDPSIAATLERASATVQDDVAALRTLMTDIYPPDLDSRGLADAVRDLVAQSDLDATTVTVDVDEPLTPSPVTARLAFRVVREAVRNVVRHSGATRTLIRLQQRDDTLLIEVADDGVGFDPAGASADGHLGQQLLQDTVGDAGGELVVVSAPDEGTRVSASLPLEPATRR